MQNPRHPEMLALHAYFDGECTEANVRSEIEAHVTICGECKAVGGAISEVRSAMTALADSNTARMASAEAVFARVKHALPAGALEPRSTPTERSHATVGRVARAGSRPVRRPPPSAGRWSVVVSWTSPALLAAAAAVAGFGGVRDGAGIQMTRESTRTSAEPVGTRTAAPSRRIYAPLVGAGVGSDLVALDLEGDATNASVVNLPGDREGSRVAVVFIDDGYDQDLPESTKGAVK